MLCARLLFVVVVAVGVHLSEGTPRRVLHSLPKWDFGESADSSHHRVVETRFHRHAPALPSPDSVVFPRDCFCVSPVFCNKYDIDSRSEQLCEEGLVCCHRGTSDPYENTITDSSGSSGSNDRDNEQLVTTPSWSRARTINPIDPTDPTPEEYDFYAEPAPSSASYHVNPDDFYAEPAPLPDSSEEDIAGDTGQHNEPKRGDGSFGVTATPSKPAPTTGQSVTPGNVKRRPVQSKGQTNNHNSNGESVHFGVDVLSSGSGGQCACPPPCSKLSQGTVTGAVTDDEEEETIDLAAHEGHAKAEEPDLTACGIDKRHLLIENKIKDVPEERTGVAGFAEFPWALLLMLKPNGILCGASLVHPRFAVTAAHCVYGRNKETLVVRAGEWNTNNTLETLEHQDVGVKAIHINSSYVARGLHNDIALLELDGPVDVTQEHINTICLPLPNDKITTPCVAVGWGASLRTQQLVAVSGSKLKKVEVKIDEMRDCEKRLRETELGPNFRLSQSSICATPRHPEFDTYLGDGGGPLFCSSKSADRHKTLVGIVSWGKARYPGSPGVYTSVRLYTDWLEGLMYDI